MAVEVLGNYEILDKLGEGGMGEVWRARFEQEARALGALNRPNVVATYDVGEAGGRAVPIGDSSRLTRLTRRSTAIDEPSGASTPTGRGAAQPLCAAGTLDSFSYYVAPDHKQVWIPGPQGGWLVYRVSGGPAQEVRGIAPNEAVIGWRSDSRSVDVDPGAEGRDSIPVSILEIAGGRRSPWKTMHPLQPVFEIHDLHVTPDGQGYAYNYVTGQSDLDVARGLN